MRSLRFALCAKPAAAAAAAAVAPLRPQQAWARVTVVRTVEEARRAVAVLRQHCDAVHAWDTEVSGMDLRSFSACDELQGRVEPGAAAIAQARPPRGLGRAEFGRGTGGVRVLCATAYLGEGVDFGAGPTLWVDNQTHPGLLAEFRDYFEDAALRKVFHAYSFDHAALATAIPGLSLRGLYADTLQMARHQGVQLDLTLGALAERLLPEREGKAPLTALFRGADGVVRPLDEVQGDPATRAAWIQYCARDACLTHRVFGALRAKLEALRNFPLHCTAWQAYRRQGVPLSEAAAGMELRGAAAPRAGVVRALGAVQAEAAEHARRCYELLGLPVRPEVRPADLRPLMGSTPLRPFDWIKRLQDPVLLRRVGADRHRALWHALQARRLTADLQQQRPQCWWAPYAAAPDVVVRSSLHDVQSVRRRLTRLIAGGGRDHLRGFHDALVPELRPRAAGHVLVQAEYVVPPPLLVLALLSKCERLQAVVRHHPAEELLRVEGAEGEEAELLARVGYGLTLGWKPGDVVAHCSVDEERAEAALAVWQRRWPGVDAWLRKWHETPPRKYGGSIAGNFQLLVRELPIHRVPGFQVHQGAVELLCAALAGSAKQLATRHTGFQPVLVAGDRLVFEGPAGTAKDAMRQIAEAMQKPLGLPNLRLGLRVRATVLSDQPLAAALAT